MKLLAFLIGIYIIALAIMPCQDNDTDQVQTQTTVQTSNCGNHSGGEICSPFCVCACCSAPRIVDNHLPAYLVPITASDTYQIHPAPAVQYASLAIWQPPQLS